MEAFLQLDPSYHWLIVGVVLLAVEAFGLPGIGFLFGGLAAIVVGVIVHLGVISSDNYAAQAGAWFGLTTVLAILLWQKLKKWRTDESSEESFSNIIGDTAIVGKGGLNAGKAGQATWSGTMMMAELSEDAKTQHIPEGEVVEIVAIKGSKLIVANKK